MSSIHLVRALRLSISKRLYQLTISLKGTTGTPKGVDVTHQNVTNLLCLAPGNIGMEPDLRVGSLLSISFDMGEFAWSVQVLYQIILTV